MLRLFAIRARALVIFMILTALGMALHKAGWDYLRSSHSEIVDMKIWPIPDDQLNDI